MTVGACLLGWAVGVMMNGWPPRVLLALFAWALFLLAYGLNRYWQRIASAQRDDSRRRSELAMELMTARNRTMHSPESVAAGRTFRPRPDDVFVVTYPKCGTTWMCQVVHMLRTGGNMDFGEITEVVPWDILALDCKQDLDARQVASPRVFKSHEVRRSHRRAARARPPSLRRGPRRCAHVHRARAQAWGDIAKGARYIYVARDPLDAFVSFHKFLPAYVNLEPSDISAEHFAQAQIQQQLGRNNTSATTAVARTTASLPRRRSSPVRLTRARSGTTTSDGGRRCERGTPTFCGSSSRTCAPTSPGRSAPEHPAPHRNLTRPCADQPGRVARVRVRVLSQTSGRDHPWRTSGAGGARRAVPAHRRVC